MDSQTQPFAAISKHHPPTPDYLNWSQLDDDLLTEGLTVEQVGKFSTTTRWRLEKAGKLHPIKIGKSKCYRVGDIRAFLAELSQKGAIA